MRKHIGVKEINAKPMTRLAYNNFRGWDLPEDENGNDEGFLVEYIDGGQANTEEFKGYVSWSPNDVFERAYRPVTGMSFGFAIETMKKGKKVARAGWNGKGMWITYNGGHANLEAENFWNSNNSDFAHDNGGEAEVIPFLSMKTADDKILMGWLASQSDMLADDWMIVD